MQIQTAIDLLDGILDGRAVDLGRDYTAYRNHAYRVLNFALVFAGREAETLEKLAIAAGFHDLGIWTHSTFDYLAPSQQLARAFLVEAGRGAWVPELEAMIAYHHKLTSYKANPQWLVEPFRRADWTDVSMGRLRFGLSGDFVRQVFGVFPSAGFHKRLAELTRQRLSQHPLSPLPMMKW